ncbi:MAG: hypothetical protein CVU07_02970 [Bacteroidetes bacterium HGW-Bacteroidetes-23]|nr:MAG: hypothetical protein CVU07_02970 [Bacteroidetes bacterium HGW-Bacteroidetes-23]
MIIKDLFSHKIHSSDDSWANKLVDLAFVFSEFDRKPYDRILLEERLSRISPRASSVARDPSKFRDEISAYPAYLGLYRVELIDGIWHFILSETAKKFLVTDEPNVPAFMLLQLLLFQYPNGMGIAYYSQSNKIRIQANTRDRTLKFINNNIHLSPLRLICKTIYAKSVLNENTILNVSVNYDEIFILANDLRVNRYANPPLENIIKVLKDFESGFLVPPKQYESRFHILKHTDFLVPDKKGIRLRNPVNKIDNDELLEKFFSIINLDIQYNGFDSAKDGDEILNSIRNGSWGRYFDSVLTLKADLVEKLTSERGIFEELDSQISDSSIESINKKAQLTYSFRKRNQNENTYNTFSPIKVQADPELTRIKRQKSNLNHKMILQKLEDYLESIGCNPVENEHIDLYAQIPGIGKYLFEVKSLSDENLLSQTRKGVSQLYEYRFRYQEQIGYDVTLCLVLPKKPEEIDWLEDYLCLDRQIGVIWFNDIGQINFPKQGENLIASLIIEK